MKVVKKDWDYYKKKHIESEIASANRWLQWIEGNIDSPIERIAFMHLIFLSNEFAPFEIDVKRQVEIGNYRVDFLVHHWDSDTWIVVECDGHDFHEKTKEQAAYDKERDRYFTVNGYIVLRYTGSQICSNPMDMYEDVGKIILERRRKTRESGGEENGPTT